MVKTKGSSKQTKNTTDAYSNEPKGLYMNTLIYFELKYRIRDVLVPLPILCSIWQNMIKIRKPLSCYFFFFDVSSIRSSLPYNVHKDTNNEHWKYYIDIKKISYWSQCRLQIWLFAFESVMYKTLPIEIVVSKHLFNSDIRFNVKKIKFYF